MSGEDKFYSPKEVRVIIDGIDITGFADGDAISVEPVTKEKFKSIAGIKGDIAYSEVSDERYILTLSLMGNSPSNNFIYLRSKAPASMTVMIKNMSAGKYLGGGGGCRVVERPGQKFGAEQRKVEWKILIPDYTDVMLPES